MGAAPGARDAWAHRSPSCRCPRPACDAPTRVPEADTGSAADSVRCGNRIQRLSPGRFGRLGSGNGRWASAYRMGPRISARLTQRPRLPGAARGHEAGRACGQRSARPVHPPGSPVASTVTTRLAPLVRPWGPPRPWKVNPPLDTPRARWVSITTIDGVASARPSTLRAGCVQHGERSRPGAVAGPAAELRPHPRPRRERLGQVPPLAAGTRDVEHRVDHAAQVRCVLGSPLARRVEHRFEQRPLLVGQVTGVRHAPDGVARADSRSHRQMGHAQ
jgi:hypothetical protein